MSKIICIESKIKTTKIIIHNLVVFENNLNNFGNGATYSKLFSSR